jgi:pyridoxal phosphate enzyme (YggS family)
MDATRIIRKNYERILENIEAAASGAGRSGRDVSIVAVTKTVDINTIRTLFDLGLENIGENRVKDALLKAEELGDLPIRWHMVGHLQRNKVKRALTCFSYIHSVDSARLAEEIDKESAKLDIVTPILLEVNASGEVAKFGIKPADGVALVESIAELKNIALKGLMTMAPFSDDMEVCRRCFARLRDTLEEINRKEVYPEKLSELSMGMTQDYPVAVEEGATIVRIGSAFFEGLN